MYIFYCDFEFIWSDLQPFCYPTVIIVFYIRNMRTTMHVCPGYTQIALVKSKTFNGIFEIEENYT